MKHWITRISLGLVVVGLLALAGSCNPFDPLAAAGKSGLKLYWVSENAVYRSDLDGSNIETIDDTLVATTLYDMAIDPENKKIYWSDTNNFDVYRADYDGSNRVKVLDSASAYRFDVDPYNDKIYWTSGNNDIHRNNLDGTGFETVFTAPVNIGDIALDLVNERIYWSAGATIYHGPLGAPLVVDDSFPDPGANITQIALDIPGGKIYWVDFAAPVIKKANLDGTNITSISPSSARGFAVDAYEGKIYWSVPTASGGMRILRRGTDISGSSETVIDFGAPNEAYGLVLNLWP